ncbi:MAG: hypothetical protein KDK00_03860 [Rhodobacteraceae bacterium]|nr:hypothetical protein [Paracoccaceae bacterium]
MRFSAIILTFILLAAASALPGKLHAGEYKKAVSYSAYDQVKLEKCFSKTFFGQKIRKCFSAGTFGGGVSGKASILTFANAETGEVGAAMVVEQEFKVKLFGKTVKVGAFCTYNSAASTSYSIVLGVSLKTPPVPRVSVVGLLGAALRAGVAAKVGPAAGRKVTARMAGRSVSSGYAGAVSTRVFRQLMSASARGCNVKISDYNIFSGIDGVDLFKAGVEFKAAATNWRIDPATASASVTLRMTGAAVAKIGGQKISFKVVGKKVSWKLPSASVKKGFKLLSKKLSI